MTQRININGVWAAVAAVVVMAMTGCNQAQQSTGEFAQSGYDSAELLAMSVSTNQSPMVAFADTPTGTSNIFMAAAPFVSPLGAGDSLGQQVFVETPARMARGQQNYERLWREMAEVETGY